MKIDSSKTMAIAITGNEYVKSYTRSSHSGSLSVNTRSLLCQPNLMHQAIIAIPRLTQIHSISLWSLNALPQLHFIPAITRNTGQLTARYYYLLGYVRHLARKSSSLIVRLLARNLTTIRQQLLHTTAFATQITANQRNNTITPYPYCRGWNPIRTKEYVLPVTAEIMVASERLFLNY